MLQTFASFTTLDLVFAASGVLFAALMRAFSGFGFALMAVPVFSLFLSPGDAVVLSASLTLLVSLMTYKEWWGRFPVHALIPLALGSVLGTAVGVLLLSGFSTQQFQLWIGLSVVAACLVLARLKPTERPSSVAVSGTTGVASGLMNGAFAIPGPPVILYVMATMRDPVVSRAFLMAFFLFSNALSLCMFWTADLVTMRPLGLLLFVFPVMLLGDRLGAWLFRRVGGHAYRPIALGVSLLVGVAITVRAIID